MSGIIDDGEGRTWVVPEGYTAEPRNPAARCRSCKQAILWAKTRNDKPAPLNPDGTSHFATCPQAPEWRRPRTTT